MQYATRSAHCSMCNIALDSSSDLPYPSEASEAKKHKLKRLNQTPNSYFMDVKCPGCFNITTVFSHAQTVMLCGSCNVMLCQPTGGRARLTEGCSFRKKVDYIPSQRSVRFGCWSRGGGARGAGGCGTRKCAAAP